MMDLIKEVIGGLNPATLLPDLFGAFAHLDVALRVLVMVGPLCLLGLGLLYLLAPPAEANHLFGYRPYWAMSSVDAWQYTQKTAGLVWTCMGFILTVVMGLICNGYRDMSWNAMLLSAFISVLVELGLIIVSIFAINTLVVMQFDFHGDRRSEKK